MTGGCGFIGLALAKEILPTLNSGDQLVLVDNLQRHGRRNDVEMIAVDPRVSILSIDLSDRNALECLPSPIDRLYHLAAIVGVGGVESDPLRVMRVNTLSTMNVLDWFMMNRSPGARLLFASSSEVYSGALMAGFQLPVPTPENVPCVIADLQNPRFSYAITKIWGEAYCNYAVEKGIFAVSVRYHNVYGPDMGYEHVIPQIVQRVVDRQRPFLIIAGEQTRSFCWVGDAVRATRLVMESSAVRPKEVVHIGDPAAEITIRNLYEKIFDICNWHPSSTNVVEAPAGSVERRCPDTTQLRLLTGYEPDTRLDHGLSTTVDWYRGVNVI